MQRITPFAWAILLAGMFALGLAFDSIAGWAQSYDTPTVASTCKGAVDVSACAALASAEATATIARWTRIDTIFSLFTAAAALFAFWAYRESKGARIAAERQAETSGRLLEDERARARGTLIVNRCTLSVRSSDPVEDYTGDVRAERGEVHFTLSSVVIVDGPSSLRDLHFGFDLIVDRHCDEQGIFRLGQFSTPPSLFRQVLGPHDDPLDQRAGFTLDREISIEGYRAWRGNYTITARLHFHWLDQFGEIQGKSVEFGLGGISPSMEYMVLQSPTDIPNPHLAQYN